MSNVGDRHRAKLDILLAAVTGPKGQLAADIRRDLVEGRHRAGALGAFAVKVVHNPTSITDEQIRALVAAGHSEDAIFECIIAAAIGAGMERLRAGLGALEREDEDAAE